MRECATTLTAEMSFGELELLARTVRSIDYTHGILEIGSAAGGSLVAMLEALQPTGQAPRIASIDTMHYFPNQLATIQRNLVSHGFSPDRVELRVGRAEKLLPGARARGEVWDLILIDANHNFRHVVMDLGWSDLLAPAGRLVLHDYTPVCPGVYRGVGWFLRRNPYYRIVARHDRLVVLGRDETLRAHWRTPETSTFHVLAANVLLPVSRLLKKLHLDFLSLS